MDNKEILIEQAQLKRAAQVYRAINHPLRQQMIRLMYANKKMTVTEIYTQLRLEQSVASQHLAILRRQGLVNTEREGRCILYTPDLQRLKQLHDLANDLTMARQSEKEPAFLEVPA